MSLYSYHLNHIVTTPIMVALRGHFYYLSSALIVKYGILFIELLKRRRDMNRKNPIAVFDSGIGGLSTLLHLQELLPYEDFIYYADEKHFPYGEKTNEEILSYVNQIINYFQEVEVKLVVIACNTVSTFIDQLQVRYDIPLLM